MVKISFDAVVTVTAGPTLQLGTTLAPDSYSVAQLTLSESGAADKKDSADLPLLPEAHDVVLLGVRVRTADGKPAEATFTPKNAKGNGDAVKVEGSVVVANRAVLAGLVKDGGPRTLGFVNKGDKPITIDVVAALDAP